MKIENLKLEEINKSLLDDLEIFQGIFYYYDRVEVKKHIDNISFENIIEARMFGENNEIKVFKTSGNLKASLLKEELEDKDNILKEEHLVIDNRFGNIKKVKIKKYISEDNDGQAYISYFRPYGLV